SLEGAMAGLVTLRGRHPHKLLRLGMRASASERLRLDLCRDDFGLYLVEAAVVGRPLGPALRLVDATERAQCPRPSRCGEWKRERLPLSVCSRQPSVANSAAAAGLPAQSSTHTLSN